MFIFIFKKYTKINQFWYNGEEVFQRSEFTNMNRKLLK